jgi:DNA-binding winged helix-turn-helix (wHTH) protein
MATLVFGSFRLDPRALELRRDGRRIRLRPQPCRVLALLASRPGDLVTRGELRAALWPDGVFVHFDLGLNSCLKQIRAALGETAGAPRFVETLSRRGYRLNAEVTVEEAGRPWILKFIPLNPVAAGSAPEGAAAAPGPAGRARSRRRPRTITRRMNGMDGHENVLRRPAGKPGDPDALLLSRS